MLWSHASVVPRHRSQTSWRWPCCTRTSWTWQKPWKTWQRLERYQPPTLMHVMRKQSFRVEPEGSICDREMKMEARLRHLIVRYMYICTCVCVYSVTTRHVMCTQSGHAERCMLYITLQFLPTALGKLPARKFTCGNSLGSGGQWRPAGWCYSDNSSTSVSLGFGAPWGSSPRSILWIPRERRPSKHSTSVGDAHLLTASCANISGSVWSEMHFWRFPSQSVRPDIATLTAGYMNQQWMYETILQIFTVLFQCRIRDN